MSTVTSALCEEAYLIASSVPLRSIYCIKFLISIIGTTCVVFLHKKKGSSWIPNPNGKQLYRVHIYLAFHVNITFAVVYFYQITRTLISFDDHCSYLLNARLSTAVKLIPVFGIHCQSFNMLTFAIERAVSTLFPARYERITKPHLGVALVTISIMLALTMDLIWDFLPIPDGLYVTGVTLRNSANSPTYQITCFLPLSLELLTITIFIMTYFLNRYKSREMETHDTNLGDRYQIEENKKVIATLFPCFLVHFFLNIFSYGGLGTYTWLNPQFTYIAAATWTECFSQAQVYTIVMPFIIFWKTRKSRKVDIVDCEAATESHFQQLYEVWRVIP